MSTTQARATIDDFTANEIGTNRTDRGTIFINVTERCDIMVGHPSSSAGALAAEIVALRKLALLAAEIAAELERRQQEADQVAQDPAELGRRQQEVDRIAQDAAARIRAEVADAAGPGDMAAAWARAEDFPHRDTYAKEGPEG